MSLSVSASLPPPSALYFPLGQLSRTQGRVYGGLPRNCASGIGSLLSLVPGFSRDTALTGLDQEAAEFN